MWYAAVCLHISYMWYGIGIDRGKDGMDSELRKKKKHFFVFGFPEARKLPITVEGISYPTDLNY